MATLLIGDPGVVRFRGYRWWADRGLIHWENQLNGDYNSQSVRVTLLRLKALNDMISNSRRSTGGYMLPDQIREMQEYIDQMIELVKKAQYQGMPDDPRVAKQKANDRRVSSRMVVLPGFNTRF